MTPLHLGQLVYTSFTIAGLRTVASKEVPVEIQQAFLEKVVYQYWDAYNPPSARYRAAYLFQVTSEDNLFGWLYNDGLDDFGRSDVPYFLCYYLPGKLHPSQLENIFICLCTGPLTLIDRQNLPVSLESLVTQNLWSYQPTRAGVKIPRQVIEESQIALKQEELLNLFVCAFQDEIKDTSIADRDLLLVSKQKIRLLESSAHEEAGEQGSRGVGEQGSRGAGEQGEKSPTRGVGEAERSSVSSNGEKGQQSFHPQGARFVPLIPPTSYENQTTIQQKLPLSLRMGEDDHQMLAAKTHLTDSQRAVLPFPGKLTLILGTIATVASLITLNYFLKVAPFAGTAQKVIEPTPNPTLDQKSTTLTNTLFGHTDSVWSVVLTKDGQTLVSASQDNTIKVWNLETAKVTNTLQGHTDTVRAIALTPDDQTLISGSADKTIKIWNLQTLKLKRTMSSFAGGIWSLAISRDGQTLVTAHENGSIQIWNFPTGQLLRTIKGHQGRVFTVAMSPDGETFATGGIDRKIKIWNLYTGECLRTIAKHQDAVRALVFSRDGKMLVSSSWDQSIKIWQMPTGKLLHTLLGHNSRVVTLNLGVAEQTLVSGGLDNKLKIWNMQTGKLLDTLSGHSDWILAIATNSTKQILVSSGRDKTIRVWQPQISSRGSY